MTKYRKKPVVIEAEHNTLNLPKGMYLAEIIKID